MLAAVEGRGGNATPPPLHTHPLSPLFTVQSDTSELRKTGPNKITTLTGSRKNTQRFTQQANPSYFVFLCCFWHVWLRLRNSHRKRSMRKKKMVIVCYKTPKSCRNISICFCFFSNYFVVYLFVSMLYFMENQSYTKTLYTQCSSRDKGDF